MTDVPPPGDRANDAEPAPVEPPAESVAPADEVALEPEAPTPTPPRRRRLLDRIAERPETPVEVLSSKLRSGSRRDFLLFAAGTLATATLAWWLLPPRTRARWLPGA